MDLEPIIPFGKYKGQPITTLLKDTNYLEWCKQQEWFKKFPIVYNICVNQTIVNQNENELISSMVAKADIASEFFEIIKATQFHTNATNTTTIGFIRWCIKTRIKSHRYDQ